MAVEFDPSQPFQVVEGETLDSLIAPRPRPVAPVVAAPVGPTFDPNLPFTPVAEPAAPTGPQFDPSAPVIKVYGLDEFTAKAAEELVADKDFMPIEFGKQFETALDPAQRTKLEQVYAARESSGTSVADKVRAAFTGIFPAIKTLREGVKSAAKLGEKFSLVGAGKRAFQAVVGDTQAVVDDYAKSATEAAASVELAALGSTDLLRRSTRAVGEAAGLLPGDLPAVAAASGVPVRRAKADMTEGDWRKRLSDDIAAAKQVETAGAGNGEVMRGLGIDAATLEKDFGIVVDPEEIAHLSVVTDPINYVPLGASVGAVTKLGGKAVRLGVAVTQTSEQAAKLAKILNTATATAGAVKSGATSLAGAAAKATGGVMEKTGLATGKVIGPVGLLGGTGLGALLGGDVYSALKISAALQAIPQALLRGGRALKAGGKILTGEAAAPAALTLAADTLKKGATGALIGAAEGSALILPFEIGARPEEEEMLLGMVGLGAAIHAGVEGTRPGARAAGKAVQNKLAESIFQRVEQEPLSESPTYGTDPLLDSTHAANVSKLAPSEQKLVNWGRELLRAAGGEVYVLDNAAFNRETGSKTAHGYAVNIGEKIAPDGSATPVFRILLNQSAEAMPHEFFHALTDLDPKRAASFRDTVKASLTPDQLKSFEQLYNSRLNNGLPEVQWKKRLTPEQVVNEATAETFSRLFLAQDLTGVSPKVQQKAALFVSSLLEKLGSPLGRVGAKAGEAGVSTLGIRPGAESAKAGQAWIANMLQRVNDEGTLGQPPIAPERPVNQTLIPSEVVRAKPATAKPAPAAPVPTPPPTVSTPVNPPLPGPGPLPAPGARNIRAARQNDFAGRRAEVTNVDTARAAAEATGDANTIARVSEISDLIESGSPVIEIEHSGARATGTADAPSGRTTRRAEQEAAYIAEGMGAAPQSIREAYQKVFVPVRWEIIAGKPQLLAMSLDKVIANTHKLVKESAARGVEGRIPYEITDGKLTDNAWGQVVDDLKAYAENQANGYRGDGQKLTRPTTDVGLSIPAENPAYNPRPITEERANFLNAVQGLNPPLTAREGRQSSAVVPGNVKGQILAEVNLRTPERPSVIRPEDITKQEFKSQPGRSIAETNPLRNELAAAGVPVRELIEVTERINARDINSVRPRPELDFKAPVTDTIRGGFLPGETPTADVISDVLKMDAAGFNAAAKSWEGGQRNRAYDLGLSTKSLEEVQLLRDAQESASADRKRFMAAKDIDNGVASALKAQFFREAYEAATDTGGAAGEIGWRQAFPDRQSPFPEAKPTGDFLPNDEKAMTGLAFKDFFSRVSKGEFGKSDVPWVPLTDISAENLLFGAVQKHSGNFDEHIAKSIPSYRETQLKKGAAILTIAGKSDEPVKVLDVGGSEGSWNKALSEQSGGKVETLVVDPNPTMAEFFRTKSQVPGAEYSESAWVRGFEDEGNAVPAFTTTDKFDVVNESMVFQFISTKRDEQVAEVKKFLKPDGLFITDEKVRTDAWAANEAKKDAEYKAVYFSKAELAKKDSVVGFQQSKSESRVVGMIDNTVSQADLEATLTANFEHVAQYWDSGNFKGYVASDSLPKLQEFLKAAGDTTSEFTTTKLPRMVEARGDFLPRGEKPMPGSIEEYDARVPRKTVFPKAKKSAATPKQSKASPTAWILPTGEVKPVSGAYHEQDLTNSRADYNKRFGTNFSDKPDVEDRVQALNKGFVRVRHIPANGKLQVEVNARFWKGKTKEAILNHLLANSEKIDTLSIGLVNDRGSSFSYLEEPIFRADNRVAAIQSMVNEVVAPKVTRAKGVGPSDIQRMRALPGEGDFLPGEDLTTGKSWLRPDGEFQKVDQLHSEAGPESELYKKGWIRAVAYRNGNDDLVVELNQTEYRGDLLGVRNLRLRPNEKQAGAIEAAKSVGAIVRDDFGNFLP